MHFRARASRIALLAHTLAAAASLCAGARAAAPAALESTDGMVVSAQHLASAVGASILRRRQRGRRGGRGRLRARRHASLLRESRRRRIHDHSSCRGQRCIHQFSREGPAGGDTGHVSRCPGQAHRRTEPRRLPGGGRTRHGAGPGNRPRKVRYAAPRRLAGAGHRAGRTRLRADPRRYRRPRGRHRRVPRAAQCSNPAIV